MNTSHVFSPRSQLGALFAVAFASLFAFACTTGDGTDEVEGCQSDSQCVDRFYCEVGSGQCLCQDDTSCDASEFCNAVGRCQPLAGCITTDDCRDVDHPLDICDTINKTCVTLNASSLQCVLSSHCPFGTTCVNNICSPGCFDSGDCALGQPCINNQCDGRSNACSDNSFCEYGQLCDVDNSTCEDHADYNLLCSVCEVSLFGLSCESCLVDSTIAPDSCNLDSDCPETDSICYQSDLSTPGYCTRLFCGNTSCDEETDPCPRGYQCNIISDVGGTPCTPDNNTCGDGRGCSASGEGVNSGYCSCLDTADCPQGTECVNPGINGSCVRGSSCGPVQGLTCWDMQ
ncbi:MAG: hypothetical protein GY822_28005 [Deltaproteobacteria bacterium]|nr:hypothetical protein [Deltaproteobacteria bacterium]